MKHNFMFETKWNYTFEEVIDCLDNQTGSADEPYTPSEVREVLVALGLMGYASAHYSNDYALSFVVADEVEEFIPTELSAIFMNKLEMRYRDHYAVQTDEELSIYSDDFLKVAKKFMTKVFNLLDYTYAKYSLLLNEYKNQKSHLLDKLQRTRNGSRSVSSSGTNSNTTNTKNLFNDTPQTTDVVATIEENQFVSELNKGQSSSSGSNSSSGSDSFSETENWDNITIMARLDEIEKQFSNIWKKWLNEFDELFIEEVNY